MKAALITITSLFLICSCASVHPGKKLKTENKNIEMTVSIKENKDLSDDYYTFLEFTFQNNSSEWMDVKTQTVGYVDEETEILANKRLEAWIEGAELKLKRKNFNKKLLLSSIAAVGAVGAVTTDGNLQVASMAALSGAALTDGVDEYGKALQAANSGKKGLNNTVNVPKSHVLNGFKVAPGSYVRRWVVIKSPKNGIQRTQEELYKIVSPRNYRFIEGATRDDVGEEVLVQKKVTGTKFVTYTKVNDKNVIFTLQY